MKTLNNYVDDYDDDEYDLNDDAFDDEIGLEDEIYIQHTTQTK